MHMETIVVYIHGKGGKAKEAAHYAPLFPDADVTGFDYKAQTPWDAKAEFPAFIDPLRQKYKSLILIANSIGAYFAMHALADRPIDRTFLISPVVDMERLILSMMAQAGVTEDELQDKAEIPAASGESLSWDYLCYVREHPITWSHPTEILYGEADNLTPFDTISDFADRIRARLTVMKGGEHWFHTNEQMRFLDSWIRQSL